MIKLCSLGQHSSNSEKADEIQLWIPVYAG